MSSITAVLDARLAREPEKPFVTFYDDATGERTEVSVRTWGNWVAKTANLLVDELMLDPGDRLSIELPVHWLESVFVVAAWSAGVETDEGGTAAARVVGPDAVASTVPGDLACALHPLVTRFTDPLPDGVLDHGLLWPGQSDVFTPQDPLQDRDASTVDGRVITDVSLARGPGLDLLLGCLRGEGSIVLVANPDEERWPARSRSERATATLREDQPSN